MSRKKVSERLLGRIRSELDLDIPEGSRLISLRSSGSQRNEGAWSWAAFGPNMEDLHFGSRETMAELVRAEALYKIDESHPYMRYAAKDWCIASDPGGN